MHTSIATVLPAWLHVNGDALQVAYQAVGGRFWRFSSAPRLPASCSGVVVHWLLVLDVALGFALSAAACSQRLPLLSNSVAAGSAYSL